MTLYSTRTGMLYSLAACFLGCSLPPYSLLPSKSVSPYPIMHQRCRAVLESGLPLSSAELHIRILLSPPPNLAVFASVPEGYPAVLDLWGIRTDSTGAFDLPLDRRHFVSAQTMTVDCTPRVGAALCGSVEIERANGQPDGWPLETVVILRDPPTLATGTVLDLDKKPIFGALVCAESSIDGILEYRSTTDLNGHFVIKGIVPTRDVSILCFPTLERYKRLPPIPLSEAANLLIQMD